jgi:SpoVK/Ycf46/Vps4 family AAA+-type ATPase
MSTSIFDTIIELPSKSAQESATHLIGFENRYNKVFDNLKLLIDTDGIKKWSETHHGSVLPIVNLILDKYPLVIFEGDVGTGKTASAMGIADRITRELKKEGFFIKLSTRVRGDGLHGQMGNLVNDAFERLKKEAGKNRIAFLLIDEADAIATTRSTLQMHQEEKSAVNTLIQKIDDIRELKGRAIVMLSTNRIHFIDEAIVRRAGVIVKFERPSLDEREQLFTNDLGGSVVTTEQLKVLAEITGPEYNNELGFSFSDLRLRVLPEAIAKVYPNAPLTFEVLEETIKELSPSPKIK